MRREGGEASSHGKGEHRQIKGNQIKKAWTFGPAGPILGEANLRPPQFRAGGVTTLPAAGFGGCRSLPPPRPSHRAVGKVIFEGASWMASVRGFHFPSPLQPDALKHIWLQHEWHEPDKIRS
jgi:hypothetical protein